MKTPTLRALLVAVLCMPATNAFADYMQYYNAGHSCQNVNREPRGDYNVVGFGVISAAGPVAAVCPVSHQAIKSDLVGASIAVHYRDNTASDGIWCRTHVIDNSGNVHWGEIKYSCGSPWGCTDPYPSYVSKTGMQSSMVLALPDLSSTNNTAGISVWCELPAGNLTSWIVGYMLYTPTYRGI